MWTKGCGAGGHSGEKELVSQAGPRAARGTRLYLGSAATVRRTVLLLTDSPQKGAWGLSVSGTQDKQRMPVE